MSKFEAGMEAMLDMFVFETSDLLEKLDDILMRTEESELAPDDVGEIFRIMHTVKGSAAMMGLQNMSALAHSLEDLFSLIRDDPNISYDKSGLYELLYEGSDGLKHETDNLSDESVPLSDFTQLTSRIHAFADVMKGAAPKDDGAQSDTYANTSDIYTDNDGDDIYVFKVEYQDTCLMPELRAMVLLSQLKAQCEVVQTVPANLDAEDAGDVIVANGLVIKVKTDKAGEIESHLEASLNVKAVEYVERAKDKTPVPQKPAEDKPAAAAPAPAPAQPDTPKQNAPAQKKQQEGGTMISVKLEKLDRLMRLTQEIVIAESGVLHSKQLHDLRRTDSELDKSSRELKKLTDELQDMVMSVRMVEVSGEFRRMNRVVRDMNKTLGKGVKLIFKGEDTEVDKSVADMLGDPLMHLVRNAIDHGIESPDERAAAGKTEEPTVTLSASYESNDVVIAVKDNGAGMDARVLLEKARQKGILTKPENEYTEQECFGLIMAAGFSTNTEVTQYSGRGVGMDVVKQNLEKIGGALSVDSKLGEGSVFTIRVPMSLSISDCLGVLIGGDEYALPIQNLEESFRATPEQIVVTPDGKEAVMRGDEHKLYRVIRLAEHLGVKGNVEELDQGIMLMCKNSDNAAALFVDALTEDMQLVIKPFSPYLASFGLKEKGLSGTSVLGDGTILLVLDTDEIMKGGVSS